MEGREQLLFIAWVAAVKEATIDTNFAEYKMKDNQINGEEE